MLQAITYSETTLATTKNHFLREIDDLYKH